MVWTRRNFIAAGAAAAASVSLFGCSRNIKKDPEMTSHQLQSPVAHCSDYFCDKFGVTQAAVDQVLSRALSRGGHWGELFFEHSTYGAVALLDGKVSQAAASTELGVGVRCVVDDQVGYAYSESLELNDMLAAADAASAIAASNAPTQIAKRTNLDVRKYYNQSIDWETLDVSRAVALLRKIDTKTRGLDQEIVQVTVALNWHQRNIQIHTSDGFSATDRQPYYVIRLSVVMIHNGETQSNSANLAALDDFDSLTEQKIDQMIREAVEDTRILFSSVKPKGGEIPVVLGAGASGILLHEAIGHGLEADFNRKDQSIFSSKLNQKVASPEVTIFDSGLFENSRGAINIDDEATPSQNTVLVENGVLKSYLHDKISAKHFGIPSTGNGRRESYKFYPIPRMRTTCMANGTHDVEELIKDVKYGVFCKKFLNGQVNIGPGDYTFYVKNGFLIENGKLTAPIKDVNIIGNGPDTLSKITLVANDFQRHNGGWTCGKNGQSMPVSLGMPSVLVSAITVGGI